MPKCMPIVWNESQTPQNINSALGVLGDHYEISAGDNDDAISCEFVPNGPSGVLQVLREGRSARITYDKPNHALRGVAALMAGLVADGEPYREQTAFDRFGIMLDCSRNAVMTVEHCKKWLRQLALMGYNVAMLYTEDTYELPGEEFFGYLRGRYTAGGGRRC